MTTQLSYEDISHRATHSAVTIMLRGLAVRGVGFAGNVVLARLLLPRDFGMVALGMTIVNIGDFLSDGGIASALVRQEGRIERRTLEAILGFQLMLTIAVAALVTAIGVPLGEAGALGALMVWSLVFDTGRMPNSIVLEREMSYRLVLQTEIIETIVWNVWAVVAVLLGAGVWGVATAQPARAGVAYVMLSMRGPNGFVRPRWDWSRVRPLLGFGLKFQGFSAVMLLRDQGLTVAIAAVGGLAAVGVWSIVYRLTLVVGVLLESLWRVSFPAMARLREAGNAPGPILTRSVSLAAVMVGLLVVPLGGTARALIPVLFGSTWNAAIDVVPLAAAAVLITGPLTAVLVGYLLAHDRPGVLARMSALDGLTSAAVGLPLLAIVGVVGLGIGSLASALVDLVILSWTLRTGWSIDVVRPMMPPVLATLAGGFGGWIMAATVGPNVLSIVMAIMFGEAIYVFCMCVISPTAAADAIGVVSRVQQRFAHAS